MYRYEHLIHSIAKVMSAELFPHLDAPLHTAATETPPFHIHLKGSHIDEPTRQTYKWLGQ
uniref:RCK n=1 Tax=Arundo donax TaxID=35708 RepID=A0A0A9H733_ARUDO